VISGWSHHRSVRRVRTSSRARPGAPVPLGATVVIGQELLSVVRAVG